MKKTFFTVAVAIVCAVAAQAQVFYKVSGNGLQKPSYIFGTHHLAPLSMLDSIPSAKAALDETERAVGEVDMTGGQMQLAAAMQPYMMAPADSTLRDLIAPDDYERVSKVFGKYAPMPGMTLDMVSGMRPMVATSMVSIGIMAKELPCFNPRNSSTLISRLRQKAQAKKWWGWRLPTNRPGCFTRPRLCPNRRPTLWICSTTPARLWRCRRN